MQQIGWTLNHMPKDANDRLSVMSREEVDRARRFHQSMPGYAPTPLVRLGAMAKRLGVGDVFVKDESHRFELNAFKVLGGAYAIARAIAGRLGRDISTLDYAALPDSRLRAELGPLTFYTATDGNHGRGVAWAARQLGQRAVVHMPKGSAPSRVDNIAREGAAVTVEPLNYDDCVRLAAAEAAADGRGVVVQDTAWEGYEEIPSWIMQGYGTMVDEALEQLAGYGVPRPTHVLVQAGVGSLAAAVQGCLTNRFHKDEPAVLVVEARAADCFYRSALAGEMRTVGGDLDTMMAGLACGEPSPLAWDLLRNHSRAFVSCPDWVSAKGMRMLTAPCKGDAPVVSGESGAVGMGLLGAMCASGDCRELGEAVALGPRSVVLMFSTEGDTDPERYRRVVWDGETPSCE